MPLSRALFVLAVLVAPSAGATELRFGVSDTQRIDADTWNGLSDTARMTLIEQRADLAVAMGATVVRMGAADPPLFSWTAIAAGPQTRWIWPDRVVAAFRSRGLEVCLTLPDVVGSGLSDYVSWVRAAAERYDGDTNFGVAEVAKNYEFPDIDGTGTITSGDWGASEAKLQEWADAHTVRMIEVGDEPAAAEDAGTVTATAYGSQIKGSSTAIRDAGGGVAVMLGGTRLSGQTESRFTARLAPLDAAGAPWFGFANAHVRESTNQLTQEQTGDNLEAFGEWLAAAGHPDAERWLGRLAIGSSPDGGPCSVAARCSERTQAQALVKIVMLAAANGLTTLIYGVPLELTGTTADTMGEDATTGLLTLETKAGFEPTLLPIGVRPAAATWMRLQEALAGLDDAAISELSGLPANARGYAIGERGWIVWYDWSREVGPDQPYGGATKRVDLPVGSAASVEVSPLWPETADTTLGADFTIGAEWTREQLAVEDGVAALSLGQDPVWVQPSDTPVGGDVGPADAGDVDPELDGGSGGGGGSDDGCAAGHGPAGPAGWLWLMALAGAVGLRRRRLSEP